MPDRLHLDDRNNPSQRRQDAFQQPYEAASSATPQTVIAAQAGKSIYITDVSISTDTQQSVKLQDNTGTPIVIVSKKYLPANSVWSKHYETPLQVAVGKELDILCSGGTGNVSADIQGYVK